MIIIFGDSKSYKYLSKLMYKRDGKTYKFKVKPRVILDVAMGWPDRLKSSYRSSRQGREGSEKGHNPLAKAYND